jgi:hypothetical protein
MTTKNSETKSPKYRAVIKAGHIRVWNGAIWVGAKIGRDHAVTAYDSPLGTQFVLALYTGKRYLCMASEPGQLIPKIKTA